MFRQALIASVFASLAWVGSASAAFPGENGYIAFTRSSGGDADIFVMNSNGSGKRNLTPQSKGDDYSPSFSADGMQVVYVHKGGITVKRVDGTGRRDLGVHGREPQFSPGGRYIVFYRLIKDFDYDVFVMRSDGTHVRNLTPPPSWWGAFQSPTFALNGDVALAWWDHEGFDIVVEHFNGKRLFGGGGVTTINRFNEDPDFSPDGSQLVFEATDSDDPALWLVGSDGSDEHAIPSTWDVAYSPAFSPDGRQIVFENYGPPGPQIAVVDTDGSNFTVLAEGSSPSWGPMPATCRGRLATIVGTEDDDTLSGTSGGDVIVGLGGNDHITGRGGDDSLCGGAGNDDIWGGDGFDRLSGNAGNDMLNGGLGRDRCAGGPGTNQLTAC